MGRKTEPREYERDGFKGEIIGPAHNCRLWINGKLYAVPFTTLTAARLAFVGYARRHAK